MTTLALWLDACDPLSSSSVLLVFSCPRPRGRRRLPFAGCALLHSSTSSPSSSSARDSSGQQKLTCCYHSPFSLSGLLSPWRLAVEADSMPCFDLIISQRT